MGNSLLDGLFGRERSGVASPRENCADDNLDWLCASSDVHDRPAWGQHWQNQMLHGFTPWAFDLFSMPPFAQLVRVMRERDVSTVHCLEFLLVAGGLLGMVACGGNGRAQRCDLPPSVSSLSPSSITAGAPEFTLTVNGDSFEVQSTLQWNGAAQQTNVVNSGQLTAVIPASDIANPGTAKISVHSPNSALPGDVTPCGGDSNSLVFSINP